MVSNDSSGVDGNLPVWAAASPAAKYDMLAAPERVDVISVAAAIILAE